MLPNAETFAQVVRLVELSLGVEHTNETAWLRLGKGSAKQTYVIQPPERLERVRTPPRST